MQKADIFDNIGNYLKSHPRAGAGFLTALGVILLLYAIFVKRLTGTFRMTQSIAVFGHLGTRIIIGIMGVVVIVIGVAWFVSGGNPYAE